MFILNKISKSYNQEVALHSVSLHIERGLTFIVGASGSGKTTLLKIIGAMDFDYEGDATYCGKNLKHLTKSEQSDFYNSLFGFVWQDANLLEDCSVLENVMLPGYLQSNNPEKQAKRILKELKIYELQHQKVKLLSGGQKQRVAIARELMKNPQVLIADEPSSALDKQSATALMELFRTLAKSRIVIVVTHDRSLIQENATVFELDKGELLSRPNPQPHKIPQLTVKPTHPLNFSNAISIAKATLIHKLGRTLISVVTLVIASVLLLTTFSGAIVGSGQKEFDQLYKTYGDALTDIGLYSSFIDASGTEGNEKKKPNGEVNQDISKLHAKYATDKRLSFLTYIQAFNDICITIDGKRYPITSSGSAPNMNKLLAGEMPMGTGNEIVVPESFIKLLGLSPEAAIGKELLFDGSVYNWDSGKPIPKKTSVKAKIVGVIDTTAHYEYQGKISSYTIDDSFLFSKSALDELGSNGSFNVNSMGFLMRAKTPADMIAIKDELNEQGIVPLGRFELVEDIVRLHNQTTNQSGFASVILASLAMIFVISVFSISSIMRRREYAIYKVSGFKQRDYFRLALSETSILAITSILCLLLGSPLLNLLTTSMFSTSILDIKLLGMGACLVLLLSCITYVSSVWCYVSTNLSHSFKSGEHA